MAASINTSEMHTSIMNEIYKLNTKKKQKKKNERVKQKKKKKVYYSNYNMCISMHTYIYVCCCRLSKIRK